MGRQWLVVSAALSWLGLWACGGESGDNSGSQAGDAVQQTAGVNAGMQVAAGTAETVGAVTAPAVVAGEVAAACGHLGATPDGSDCSDGLQCRDVAAALGASQQLPIALTACSCPNTGLPPVCDPNDPNTCSAYAGTSCRDPGALLGTMLGNYCLTPSTFCTLPGAEGEVGAVGMGGGGAGAADASGGQMAGVAGAMVGGPASTGGDNAGTAGMMAGAEGEMASAAAEDPCPGELVCSDMGAALLGMPGAFLCGDAALGIPPGCPMMDQSACDAIGPGFICLLDMCVKSCMP